MYQMMNRHSLTIFVGDDGGEKPSDPSRAFAMSKRSFHARDGNGHEIYLRTLERLAKSTDFDWISELCTSTVQFVNGKLPNAPRARLCYDC